MKRGVRCALLFCLSLPLTLHAASGAWSQKSAGGVLSVGNQKLSSSRLAAPPGTTAQARVTRISWQIALLTPPPPELEAHLCSPARCIKLHGLAGRLTPDVALPSRGPFWFVYIVKRRGPLTPPLHVVSNTLTVNHAVSLATDE
ncbi:flagellar protein FlhE [Entomohabitans teleogrylli]|uniref:flagellar protein FlhE n=1 Tax=Entomohabitans teleogrylli TaxID=1384589 RepID=UPI00073D3B7D|nr:flagellar protein FlhE [Entomohabitans teleogrylli]